jgi:hypothetical protein
MARAAGLFGVLVVAFALAACGEQNAAKSDPPPPVAEGPALLETSPWRGFPADQSATIAGDRLTIPVNGGAMRVAANPEPAAGDTFAARLRMTSATPVNVRIALYRHCNADRGDEGDSREIALSPTETDLTLRYTFSQAYDCVRVHIVSIGQPAVITVSEFSLTKESPAAP